MKFTPLGDSTTGGGCLFPRGRILSEPRTLWPSPGIIGSPTPSLTGPGTQTLQSAPEERHRQSGGGGSLGSTRTIERTPPATGHQECSAVVLNAGTRGSAEEHHLLAKDSRPCSEPKNVDTARQTGLPEGGRPTAGRPDLVDEDGNARAQEIKDL
jgi:hypothetical protein